MKNPDHFFKIHFNQAGFSIAEVTAFAEDHQARLVENNTDGSLDTLIAETATALEAFTGTVGEAKIVKAVQQARISAKNQQLAEIKESISRQSGLIIAKFGKDSPVYLRFFPQGLSEFHNAREVEIVSLLERLTSAAKEYLPELEAVFNKHLTQWQAVSGAASRQKAASSASSQSRQSTLEALQEQLTRNLLKLGLRHLGQPEMAKRFFNTSLLYNRKSSTSEEEPEEASEN